MIIDFAELKKIINNHVINKLDHTLLLAKKGELAKEFEHYQGKLVWMEKEPTAEYMLLTIKNWIIDQLPTGIHLVQLQLWETKTAYAQWHVAME
jgi:6-pyruvoyltetrahydropterin/6-carboxytetrahydropterin synthase